MRNVFGALFLLAGIACFGIAYANGGPALGEPFDLRKAIGADGIYVGLGGLVCLVLAVLLLFTGKKKQAVQAGA